MMGRRRKTRSADPPFEDALALADEIRDGHTGYLIERALDEARSRLFRLFG
jgi:hypothetical protein